MAKEVEYAWLQISDLHIFGDNVTEWNILKQEINNIKDIKDIRFILITGDLHQYECFILGKHTARNGVAGISPPRREFQKC